VRFHGCSAYLTQQPVPPLNQIGRSRVGLLMTNLRNVPDDRRYDEPTLDEKSADADFLREMIGMSEAETIWTEFLRKLTRRGLRGA